MAKIKCEKCNGDGFTAEHANHPHPDGDCLGECPIQVQCERCEGTGEITLAPVCRHQTHNFHIARHGKCQDCGGTEWMDAPAPAQEVEIADWTRNYLSKKYPTISEDDMEGDELRLYFTIIVDALTEYTAGSRWQQGQGELEALRRWKAEAIEVVPDMQAIGKALGLRIGESIHDKILPGIEKLKQKAATPTIGERWVREVACRFAEWVSWNYSRVEGQQDVWIAEFGFDDSDKLTTDLWKQFEIGNTFKEISEKHSSPYLPTREQAQEWIDDKYGKGTPWVVHFGDDQERFATEKEANEFLQKLKSAYIKKL